MKRLAIIGSGDLALLASHHAQNLNFNVVGFFDDFKAPGEIVVKNIPILGTLADVEAKRTEFDELFIAIGYKHLDLRERIFNELAEKYTFATLIHASCILDSSVKIGVGSFILPGCTLDFNVSIGRNSVLNTGVTIAHDSKIGDHSFLGPAVNLAGFIKIGDKCFLGINTTVIDNIKVDAGVRTGGGAVIINNINEPGLYVGMPAKKIK